MISELVIERSRTKVCYLMRTKIFLIDRIFRIRIKCFDVRKLIVISESDSITRTKFVCSGSEFVECEQSKSGIEVLEVSDGFATNFLFAYPRLIIENNFHKLIVL